MPVASSPTEGAGGAATRTSGSDAPNQENIQARAEALYVKMMEKQVHFKEAVEPFKTDNQNAGKV